MGVLTTLIGTAIAGSLGATVGTAAAATGVASVITAGTASAIGATALGLGAAGLVAGGMAFGGAFSGGGGGDGGQSAVEKRGDVLAKSSNVALERGLRTEGGVEGAQLQDTSFKQSRKVFGNG